LGNMKVKWQIFWVAMAGHGQGSVSSASAPNFTCLKLVADEQIPELSYWTILVHQYRAALDRSREFSALIILATIGRRKAWRQEEPGHKLLTYYIAKNPQLLRSLRRFMWGLSGCL